MANTSNIHLLSDIQRDVRMALDQNQVEQGVLQANRDTLELDDLIAQKVVHAARLILENAPLWMVSEQGSLSTIADGEYAYIVSLTGSDSGEPQSLPRNSDFLRAISFNVLVQVGDGADATREPGWEHPVSVFQPVESDAYRAACSKFCGIKPNAKRPAVFYNQESNEFLFFGCDNGAPTYRCLILPHIKTFSGATPTNQWTEYTDKLVLTFPDVLYDALVYQTAALVETAYKNAPAAQMLSGIARGYMGISEDHTKPNRNEKREN